MIMITLQTVLLPLLPASDEAPEEAFPVLRLCYKAVGSVFGQLQKVSGGLRRGVSSTTVVDSEQNSEDAPRASAPTR